VDIHRRLIVAAPPAIPKVGRLAIDGNYFTVDGRLWFWIGFTGFLLLKRMLTGREADAYRYMEWVASTGGNIIRVFSQVRWDGPPTGLEQGFFARDFPNYDAVAHKMFDEAAARGVYIELVAHTFPQDLRALTAHSQRCDAIVSAHLNGVYEDANEPAVNGIDIKGLAAAFVPTSLAASGQYEPTPHPGRGWCNDHPPRDAEFCRKFKGAWEFWDGSGPYTTFQPPWKGPVVLDEPERVERAGTDDDWKAFCAGARLFAAGVTIHGGDWAQRCIVPTDPALLNRIKACITGIGDVPHQRYFGYQHPDDRGSLRRYRRKGEDGRWYEISVRPYSFGAV
jgi:hypothetical protein